MYIYKPLAVRNSGIVVYFPATCHSPYFLTQICTHSRLTEGYFLNHCERDSWLLDAVICMTKASWQYISLKNVWHIWYRESTITE